MRCVARAVTAFRTQKQWRCAPLRHSNLSYAAADQLDDQVPKFIDFDSPPIVFRKRLVFSIATRAATDRMGTANRVRKTHLRNQNAGWPRGRVSRVQRGYVHDHRGDAPYPQNLETVVKQKFGLRSAGSMEDVHERMLADDVNAVQSALGNFGLTGVSPMRKRSQQNDLMPNGEMAEANRTAFHSF